ncbi:ABC transporter permease [Saccharomonospora sp. CUA-673]|uniref:ABC transporter permease n=1 Tax=Saccharomonospora sp. CUA-673 TaxID=1904969 RepID=UPI000AFA4747|nr:ABC transporter permease [Saccharomonospora sp. CUA-673]
MADIDAPPRPVHGAPTRPGGTGRARRVLVGSAGVVAFLALWELAPRLGLVDSIFLPPFSRVVQAMVELSATGELWEHFGASLARSLAGFVVAAALAVPLGILIGWYRPVHVALNPLLELFRNTAALALLPVFVLLLGLGELSKVSLVVFACTWPILLNTVSAVRTVDPLLIKSARSLGFSPLALFGKVVLPASVRRSSPESGWPAPVRSSC